MQRMYRIAAEAEAAKQNGAVMHDVRAEANISARKF